MAAATAYRAAEWLVFPLHLANQRATGDVRELDHWEQLWPLGCTDTSNKKFTTVLSTETLFETAILFWLWISSVLMLARHFFFSEGNSKLVITRFTLVQEVTCSSTFTQVIFYSSFHKGKSSRERGRGAGWFPHYIKSSRPSLGGMWISQPLFSTQLQ